MDVEVLLGIAAGVIMSLFVAEFGGWAQRAALAIIRLAVKALPEGLQERYRRELSAEVRKNTHRHRQAAVRLGILVTAPSIGRAMRSEDPHRIRREEVREKRRLQGLPITLVVMNSVLLTTLAGGLIYATAEAGSLPWPSVVEALAASAALASMATFVFALQVERRAQGGEGGDTPRRKRRAKHNDTPRR